MPLLKLGTHSKQLSLCDPPATVFTDKAHGEWVPKLLCLVHKWDSHALEGDPFVRYCVCLKRPLL